jgi:hypothetical protein
VLRSPSDLQKNDKLNSMDRTNGIKTKVFDNHDILLERFHPHWEKVVFQLLLLPFILSILLTFLSSPQSGHLTGTVRHF